MKTRGCPQARFDFKRNAFQYLNYVGLSQNHMKNVKWRTNYVKLTKIEVKLSETQIKFQRADANGDGLLSEEEYFRILNDHGIECTRDEIKEIIRLADKDNDG